MRKTHLDPSVLSKMQILADGVRNRFSYKSHKVEQAMELDDDFTLNARPASALQRNIVQAAIEEVAPMAGIETNFAQSIQFASWSDDQLTEFVWRVKRAKRTTKGVKVLAQGGGTGLWGENAEGALIRQVPGVFGYIPSGGEIEIFVAEALAIRGANPGVVELGELVFLGSSPVLGSFVPRDEELPGFELDGFQGIVLS